jgi:Flp pilus assembly secretin CpaC
VIENNVIADDGQIIVLGGLIEDTEGDGTDKVRGLGDIPVLGNLFKYQTRSRKKTNLMVFLRPVVMRNKEQSTAWPPTATTTCVQQEAVKPPTACWSRTWASRCCRSCRTACRSAAVRWRAGAAGAAPAARRAQAKRQAAVT